jgi:AmmeMemoRadiSam system protein B
VIGTNHTTAGFTGVSIYPNGAFASPIGNVKVDNQIAKTHF